MESIVSGTHPLKKRKRGRPETTGQYAIFKQRKKEEQVTERERREEALLMDEDLKFNKNLPTLEDLMDDMVHLPTPDIMAETIRHIDGVARMAQVFTKMKETIKKTLNEAALNAKAALTTLAIRTQKFETEAAFSKEIESLRGQIRMLKADNARLTAEGESARASLQNMEKKRWKPCATLLRKLRRG